MVARLMCSYLKNLILGKENKKYCPEVLKFIIFTFLYFLRATNNVNI